MLPFLRPQAAQQAHVTTTIKPEGGMSQDEPKDQALETCCESMLRAISAKDSKALAQAFRDAFTVVESEEQPEEDNE